MDMTLLGENARQAAKTLATTAPERKQAALIAASEAILARTPHILDANAQDMAAAQGLTDAMRDRLLLTEPRLQDIATSLCAIADQVDPVGEIMADWTRPNGLRIQRVRTPIGVIGVIYESRPNVTVDAAALCLKSGNAVILRGGSESFHSATALHAAFVSGLASAGLPETAAQMVPTRDRAAVSAMLQATDHIDVIVPRGGKGLVGLVQREARVPVFAHLEGIVHIYIDADADPQKTLDVVINAKTRRTGICGAAECLLVHQDAAELGQTVLDTLADLGVETRTQGLSGTRTATEDDWGREYLDSIIAARTVPDITAAIAHIDQYGSGHTDCILTENPDAARQFFSHLDSAILMHNASTQFADGGEFGMGAEIGIATGKLHARGPVGAEQLTTFKYLVTGDGTTRP